MCPDPQTFSLERKTSNGGGRFCGEARNRQHVLTPGVDNTYCRLVTTKPRFAFPEPEARLMGASASTDQEWSSGTVGDASVWRELFHRLYAGMGSSTYPQRAARLSGYGWAPGDLERVCSGAPHVAALSDPEGVAEEQAEARAALLHEALIFYSNGLSAASYNRTGYIVRLADLGWKHSEIGRHVRLTKQRVQKLIKDWR